ncbi:unnamed protein product [marine sediment metagenome]|uniref:Uncharacterized protein n=1 Tax=marine sediment metagenome TaxID=412755 RepID=X0VEF6_9ZZZZ
MGARDSCRNNNYSIIKEIFEDNLVKIETIPNNKIGAETVREYIRLTDSAQFRRYVGNKIQAKIYIGQMDNN